MSDTNHNDSGNAPVDDLRTASENGDVMKAPPVSLLQLALDHTHHGIAMFDSETCLIAVNARYLEIYGFSPNIVKPGITIDEILRYSISLGNYSRADARRVFSERKNQIARDEPTTYHQHLADDRTIAVSHRPVPHGGSVSTCEDITDVIAREQRIADLARQAAWTDAENVAKSRFLSNMSHELRTPLNAVLGFSEVMTRETFGPMDNEHYAEYASSIHIAADKMLALVDSLLDMALIDEGQVMLQETEFAIDGLIEDVLQEVRDRAAQKGIVLRVSREGVPRWLRGDRQRLFHALGNILDNAVKFCLPGGLIVVTVGIRPTGDWYFTVSNTGPGISDDAVEALFKPFGQEEAAEVRQHHGAGIGLPIALGLLRLHNGEITIESEPDVGTTVTCSLPAERVRSDTTELSADENAERAGAIVAPAVR